MASGEVVDYGMVGDIDAVDCERAHAAARRGFLPVVSPSVVRQVRTAAQHQRRSRSPPRSARRSTREADPLHRRARHPRALDDPHSLISYTDVGRLRRLREEGAISDGMLPKASAIEPRSAAACVACT
jgi:acetylglutamate kinase